jgi:lysophospholipase L1-like esterase
MPRSEWPIFPKTVFNGMGAGSQSVCRLHTIQQENFGEADEIMSEFVVYGDSIPAGYGVPYACSFVPIMQRQLSSKTRSVRAVNLSIPGLNTFDFLEMTACGEGFSFLPASSFVVVFIGGNDLIAALPLLLSEGKRTLFRLLPDWQQAFRRSLQLIRRRTNAPLLVGTLYNPFPNSPIAGEAVSLYNAQVILPAAKSVHACPVPIYEAFLGREAALIQGYSTGIAGDPGRQGVEHPVHPNCAGHQVIAREFLHALS